MNETLKVLINWCPYVHYICVQYDECEMSYLHCDIFLLILLNI